eukprot:347414-Chlamydomonas_euryale.AAC.1
MPPSIPAYRSTNSRNPPECSCLPRHNNSGPQEKHDLTYARHPFLRPSHVNAFGITAAITAEREEGSHHEAACA